MTLGYHMFPINIAIWVAYSFFRHTDFKHFKSSWGLDLFDVGQNSLVRVLLAGFWCGYFVGNHVYVKRSNLALVCYQNYIPDAKLFKMDGSIIPKSYIEYYETSWKWWHSSDLQAHWHLNFDLPKCKAQHFLSADRGKISHDRLD